MTRSLYCTFSIWLVLALVTRTGELLGRSDSKNLSWDVRIAFLKHVPQRKGPAVLDLKARTLSLSRKDGVVLQIPVSQIRATFYDRALLKKALKRATEPGIPGEKRHRVNAYDGASVALGVAFGSQAAVYAAFAPALAFPPALLAVGGVAAITAVKKATRKHFLHIIWEDNGISRAVALTFRGKEVNSVLAALDAVTLEPVLNLPEERRLWGESRADSKTLTAKGPLTFGQLHLNKGRYTLVFVDRGAASGELYFFRGESSTSGLEGVVEVMTRELETDIMNGLLVKMVGPTSNEILELGMNGFRLRPRLGGTPTPARVDR